MKDCDDITGSQFRHVVRLMKYVKRHRNNMNGVKSVVLTVVAGMQVDGTRTLYDPGHYEDLPTAFLNIVEDLNDWLQARPLQPSVPNPGSSSLVGADATFDHRWDQTTYSNFRDRWNTLAADVRTAYDAAPDDSIAAWQAVFGDKFNPPKSGSNSAGRFGPAAAVSGMSSRSGKAG